MSSVKLPSVYILLRYLRLKSVIDNFNNSMWVRSNVGLMRLSQELLDFIINYHDQPKRLRYYASFQLKCSRLQQCNMKIRSLLHNHKALTKKTYKFPDNQVSLFLLANKYTAPRSATHTEYLKAMQATKLDSNHIERALCVFCGSCLRLIINKLYGSQHNNQYDKILSNLNREYHGEIKKYIDNYASQNIPKFSSEPFQHTPR